MSYGKNGPQGAVVTKSITGAPWTGQENPYPIISGYSNNIFKGDLVAIKALTDPSTSLTANVLVNYWDLVTGQNPANETVVAVGVFNGCDYVSQDQTQIGNALPGRSFWPAGTLTQGNQPATAYVIDDPNAVINIQVGGTTSAGINSTAATAAMANKLIAVNYLTDPANPGLVLGNFSNGMSLMFADATQVGQPGGGAYRPLMIQRLVAAENNEWGIPFNNVECIIANHMYRLSSLGL